MRTLLLAYVENFSFFFYLPELSCRILHALSHFGQVSVHEGRWGGSFAAEGREGSEEGRPMKKSNFSRDCEAVAKQSRKRMGESRHLMLSV